MHLERKWPTSLPFLHGIDFITIITLSSQIQPKERLYETQP
jgi:hypothetical protein